MNIREINQKEKNKARMLLYIANFCIIIITFAVYIFNTHYSEDSFEAMLDIGALARTNLRNGRIIHYLLYAFFDRINFNILVHQRVTQIILTLVLSYGVATLTEAFGKIAEKVDIWKVIMIDVAFLFIFLNPCFLFGWYYWPETCIGASLSLLVTFWAIMVWCRKELKLRDIILSFALLCVSIGMYQVYVELYVGICLAYTLLKYGFQCNKDSIKEYVIIIVSGGVGSVLNIVGMSIIQKMGATYADNRSATMSVQVVLDNFRTIVNAQHDIWYNMNGFLPRYYLIVFVVGILLFILTAIIIDRKKIKAMNAIFLVINLVTIYVLAFVPNIISGSVWLAPRTYIGIYAFVFLLLLYALSNVWKNKVLKKAYVCFMLLFLFTAVLRLLQLETNTIVSNRLDEREIKTIGREIQEYETQTGTKVETISYAYDSARRYGYDEVNYQAYDSNVRGMAYSWCFTNMIKYFVNLDAQFTEMTQDEYQTYFNDKQWDEFQPEQQLHFEGDMLYVVIY